MHRLIEVSRQKSFSGWQTRHQHHSVVLDSDMHFSIYLPPQAEHQSVPVLYWLSGLTCTDENFVTKAGAQRIAAELGLALVCPDTSPRGDEVADDAESWDLGKGAGFYVNATQPPWQSHYQMYDYVTKELPALIEQHFPVTDVRSISGHSMGGHGALVVGLRNPDRYRSISAFAPIVNPTQCPWGIKAFSQYLGADTQSWQAYDACALLSNATQQIPILIDQGGADGFLDEQLKPRSLQRVAETQNYPITLNIRQDYDHSYYFIASFIEYHVRFHAEHLLSGNAASLS